MIGQRQPRTILLTAVCYLSILSSFLSGAITLCDGLDSTTCSDLFHAMTAFL